ALHYIDRNLHNPAISARLIAKECHMSVRYLHHLLAANNTSLGTLIRTRRLSRAAEWLSAADMRTVPVSQISYMAGFKNPEHFSRAFKATLGASPSQFRRALNGQSSSKSGC
ncbi:MAG: helix-turn-helix transcriptional regulator, partial [Caulobacterales bacterium]